MPRKGWPLAPAFGGCGLDRAWRSAEVCHQEIDGEVWPRCNFKPLVFSQFRTAVDTHRPKYACRACEEAPVQAPAPERLIKGGLPTEAMVAYVLAAKYAWHLPLYRQAQILLSQGVAIERATLAFWVGYAAAELKPLYLRLRELILGSLKIAVDETVAPVLDPGRGRTKKGYFWAIARDDRPWGGTDPPAIAYTYAPGRGAVHALKLLDTYHGIVQCDGYAAYKNIANAAYLGEAITLAFCWAHLRRKFFEIAKGGSAPIASEALDRIALLYAIEKTIRGRSADERRAVRQEKSKPLVLALKIWLEEQLARVSAKSVIAEAIRYGLNHWDGLVRFLEDGRIELGRVDDWRGGGRQRGLTVSGGFRPRRCRSSLHGFVSSRRSSNRACGFPAPGFLSSHQAFALGKSLRLRGMRKSPSVSCR